MKGTVRVHVNGAGKGARVSVYIHQFMASGMMPSVSTNDEGDAYITLDTDNHAEAEIYIDGQLRVKRGSIQDTYYI